MPEPAKLRLFGDVHLNPGHRNHPKHRGMTLPQASRGQSRSQGPQIPQPIPAATPSDQ